MASKWGSTLHLFPYSCQKGVDSPILLCLQNVMSENLQQLLAGVQSCTKLLSVETNHPLDSIIEYVWGYYVIKEYLLFILEYINVEELFQVQREYRILWETFEGENFCKFCSFVAICKSFVREIWRCGILWHSKSEQSAKVFSVKIVFSPICESFLIRKFPTVWYCMKSILFNCSP